MTIATKSVAQLDAGYVACAKLVKMLEDYHQGTNAPATQLGRFTVAQVNTQIQAAIDALVVLVPQGGG